MPIAPRNWTTLGEYTLLDNVMKAKLGNNIWFGKSNKELLTNIAEMVRNVVGDGVTYECVLLKLNELWTRHKTWLWVTQQPGLYVHSQTMTILGSEEVWERIITENPGAEMYKQTPEKWSMALNVIFGYPFCVAGAVKNEASDGDELERSLEVIDVSDDESKMNMEVVPEFANNQGTSFAPSVPSNGKSNGYSTASSPFPPKIWKK